MLQIYMAACGLLTGAKVVICVKFTSKNSDGLHFGLAQTIRHSVTKYSLKVQDPDVELSIVIIAVKHVFINTFLGLC